MCFQLSSLLVLVLSATSVGKAERRARCKWHGVEELGSDRLFTVCQEKNCGP